MNDKAKVIEALEGLTEPDTGKVLDFIDSLKHSHSRPQVGRIDAVLQAVGSWWMAPDETRQFLKEVEQMRHREAAERAIPPQY